MASEKSPQELLEEQYQELLDSVKSQDEDTPTALSDKSPEEFQSTPYEAPLVTKASFNQAVLWVAGEGAEKLATSLLSTVPGAAALAPAIKWALAKSLELPKEDQEILEGKIDALSEKIDVLKKEVKETVDLINCSADGKEVEKIKASIDTFGRNLMLRKETNDPQEFRNLIAAIGQAGDNGMYGKLATLDAILVGDPTAPRITNSDNKAVNQPLLYQFRNVLQDRVTDTDRAFFYDIVDYQRDMEKWFAYVKGIQVKGNSLLIMEQLYKLVEARCSRTYSPKTFVHDQETIIKTIRRYNEDLQARVHKYEEVLYERGNGILDWESCKLLLRASKVDLKQRWPTLYRLEHADMEGCLQIHDGQGLIGYGLLEEGQRIGRTEYSSSFGFERYSSNRGSTWGLRGSRFSVHPQNADEAHLQRAGPGNDSQWGLFKGVTFSFGDDKWARGTKLHIKVAPKPNGPGDAPRATLVFLSENGEEAKKKYDVCIRETGLPLSLASIGASHPPAEPPKLTANYPFGGFAQAERYCTYRVKFQIQNLTKPGHVLVLQDVRGCDPSGFRTHGTVWLNQQRASVGLLYLGDEVHCVMRFKLFRLLNGSHDGREESQITDLLFIDPEIGKLSLRSEGATPLADIFVKIDNPSGVWRNYVSATAFRSGTYSLAFGDLHTGGYDSSKVPEAVVAELDANAQVQGGSWGISRANVGLAYTISGGDKPTGEITITSNE